MFMRQLYALVTPSPTVNQPPVGWAMRPVLHRRPRNIHAFCRKTAEYLALVETTSAVCSIYDIGRRAEVASAEALHSRPITLEKYSPGGGRPPANRRDGD